MARSKPFLYKGVTPIFDPISPTEHYIQARFVMRCKDFTDVYPELWGLHATPNGGKRSHITGSVLRSEGVKRGYPDLSLDVARGGYHGWRCEFKYQRNLPSEDQEEWIAFLRAQGYYVCVYWSADEAFADLIAYLDGNPRRDVSIDP